MIRVGGCDTNLLRLSLLQATLSGIERLNLFRSPLSHFIVDREHFCRVMAEAAFQRMRFFLQRNFFEASALDKPINEPCSELFEVHLRVLHHVNKFMEKQRIRESSWETITSTKVIAVIAAKSGRLRMPIILAMAYIGGFDTRVPRKTQSRAASNIAGEKNGCITLRCAFVSGTA